MLLENRPLDNDYYRRLGLDAQMTALMPPADEMRPQCRRAIIDGFLAELSPWEILYLRTQLRRDYFWVNGLAGLADLPPELVCFIAELLHPKDILSCRLVCRSWLQALNQEAVITSLCHHFFPGLRELHEQDIQRSSQDLFLCATKCYLRRHLADPLQVSFVFYGSDWNSANHQPSPGEGPLDCKTPDVVYGAPGPAFCVGGGKIAWRVSPTHVIVDDLRTLVRQICALSSMHILGQQSAMQAVSKSLLVFASTKPGRTSSRYSLMRIWHLGLGKWESVALPGNFSLCFVDDDHAAFVTTQGHIIVWSWSGKSFDIEVDRNVSHSHSKTILGVIFHPIRRAECYVSFLCHPRSSDATYHARNSDETATRFLILKYANGCPVYDAVFERDIAGLFPLDSISPWKRQESAMIPLFHKSDNHGLYTLAAFRLSGNEHDRADAKATAGWGTVGFNVLTETFIIRNSCLGHSSEVPPEFAPDYHDWAAVWDDELIVANPGGGMPVQWVDLCTPSEVAPSRRPGTQQACLRSGVCSYVNRCRERHVFADSDGIIFTTSRGFLVGAFSDIPKLPNPPNPDEF